MDYNIRYVLTNPFFFQIPFWQLPTWHFIVCNWIHASAASMNLAIWLDQEPAESYHSSHTAWALCHSVLVSYNYSVDRI